MTASTTLAEKTILPGVACLRTHKAMTITAGAIHERRSSAVPFTKPDVVQLLTAHSGGSSQDSRKIVSTSVAPTRAQKPTYSNLCSDILISRRVREFEAPGSDWSGPPTMLVYRPVDLRRTDHPPQPPQPPQPPPSPPQPAVLPELPVGLVLSSPNTKLMPANASLAMTAWVPKSANARVTSAAAPT